MSGASALGMAYLLVLVFFRLGNLLGLQGDEAARGIDALEVLAGHPLRHNSFNRYTGPLHTLLISPSFSAFGPDRFSLRLPGALLNALSFIVVAALAYLRFGARAGLGMVILLLSSAYQIYLARVAIEVLALQNLCAAVVLWTMTRSDLDECILYGPTVWYGWAVWVGVTSHFIYLTVVLAILVGALSETARTGRHARLAISVSALVACLVLVATKVALPPEIWSRAPWFWTALWVVCPFLSGLLGPWLRNKLPSLQGRWLVLRCLQGLVIGSIVFALARGIFVGLAQTLAGRAVHLRIVGYDPGIVLSILMWVSGLALFVTLLYGLYRSWVRVDCHHWLAVFLLAWPTCMFLTGAWRTPLRYFAPIHLFVLWYLVCLAESSGHKFRGMILSFSSLLAIVQLSAWIPLSGSYERVHMKVGVGYSLQPSYHYLPKRELVEASKDAEICRFEGDFNLKVPLHFYWMVDGGWLELRTRSSRYF